MRALLPQSIEDIAIGSGVLGAGGGGDPYIGKMVTLHMSEMYGPPQLVLAKDLPDDAMVISPFGIGSALVGLEKFPFGPELDRAYNEFVSMVGRPASALVAIEIGGMNSMTPLILGARLGIPVLDADLIGRAAPHMGLTTAALNGVLSTPTVIADAHGNLLTIKAIDDQWCDRIARAAIMEFGAMAVGCGYMMSGKQSRIAPVQGSISYAEAIGRSMREAQAAKGDLIRAILDVTGGSVLFSGKVVDVQRKIAHSHHVGQFTMAGTDADRGATCVIDFENENLIAWRDGEVIATTPDLITLLDIDSGATVQTELVRYGLRAAVLGIPADSAWHTPAGIALFGPGGFGYDVPFHPVPLTIGSLSADS
jgi:uncharacterized protein